MGSHPIVFPRRWSRADVVQVEWDTRLSQRTPDHPFGLGRSEPSEVRRRISDELETTVARTPANYSANPLVPGNHETARLLHMERVPITVPPGFLTGDQWTGSNIRVPRQQRHDSRGTPRRIAAGAFIATDRRRKRTRLRRDRSW